VIEPDCTHPWWVALPKRVFRCNDCDVEVTLPTARERKRLANNPVRLRA
jgi:hypothetical protein